MAVHLFVGDDESILRAAVSTLVASLVGKGDRDLMVDEFDGEEYTLGAVADAAQTPPFLTDSRVVVARGVSRFTTDELGPLLTYLGDQLDSTELVLEWGSGRRPKALSDALKSADAAVVTTTAPSRARDRQGWIVDQARQRGIKLTTPAAERLAGHLGENVGELGGIASTLAATFGDGATIGPDDLEPFLGEAGGVPPWDLTDAIDGGRTDTALGVLHRMLGAGGRHPLQVMAILHTHYSRLAALDGAGARTEDDAAAAMGIKPGYPARKALELSRKLGAGAVHRAIDLLAAADLDLRGATMLDERVVMEVLVARLSRLGR